jgi:hypothetical protein
MVQKTKLAQSILKALYALEGFDLTVRLSSGDSKIPESSSRSKLARDLDVPGSFVTFRALFGAFPRKLIEEKR